MNEIRLAPVRIQTGFILPDAEYRTHPRARLLAAVVRLVREIVPENPNAPEFRLRDDLARFRRAKGHGLPERYRLFWVFSSKAKAIVFLYLNDEKTLRKEGSRNDPYERIKIMVQQGSLGENFKANRLMINEENRNQNPPSPVTESLADRPLTQRGGILPSRD